MNGAIIAHDVLIILFWETFFPPREHRRFHIESDEQSYEVSRVQHAWKGLKSLLACPKYCTWSLVKTSLPFCRFLEVSSWSAKKFLRRSLSALRVLIYKAWGQQSHQAPFLSLDGLKLWLYFTQKMGCNAERSDELISFENREAIRSRWISIIPGEPCASSVWALRLERVEGPGLHKTTDICKLYHNQEIACSPGRVIDWRCKRLIEMPTKTKNVMFLCRSVLESNHEI